MGIGSGILSTPVDPITIRLINVSETWPLRARVLRPGLPVASAQFAEDDTREGFHVGAFRSGSLIGVASFFCESRSGEPSLKVWRLRGMATAPEAQGTGIGSRVLQEGLGQAAMRGAALVWCNARSGVRGFYERHGFRVDGPEFDIPGIGPHLVMELAIPASRLPYP